MHDILPISQSDIYREYIEALTTNKNVVDLACGDGWAGKIALECGATSVKFADARLESFILPVVHTNYQHTFIDLNFPKSLEPLLLGADIVLYFGHLYHCNNHEEILDALINSDCTDFFIDTKIGFGSTEIDLEFPAICWYNPEIVSDPYNGWHSTDTHIKAGAPNLSWMLDYFNRKNLEVIFQQSVDNVHIRPGQDPYYHRIYLFHVVKSNTI
jgi:hypothetical protein